MSKKILLVIGILAIVAVAAFLVLFSEPQTNEEGERVGFSIRDYLPFGQSEDIGEPDDVVINRDEPGEDNEIFENANQPIPRLRKLSKEPVSGAVIYNTATTSIVRFVEKGTGNVYEASSRSLAIERLTNTTIPKIIRAFWLPDGSGFLAQTVAEDSELVETSLVKLKKNAPGTTTESLTPFNTTVSKLPTGIKEIAIKPDGSKIFYYTAGASSNWFISNPDGTAAAAVLTHPLTEWLPKWATANTITLQTKSSSESLSYMYSFDISSKALIKTAVNAGGISQQTGTLAEKCVQTKDLPAQAGKNPVFYCAVPNFWPKGNYPDVWYQGLISTEDSIKKIDVANDIFYNIADLSSLSDQKIDVVDIAISPDQTHLIFRNKIDGFLWMLRIAE